WQNARSDTDALADEEGIWRVLDALLLLKHGSCSVDFIERAPAHWIYGMSAARTGRWNRPMYPKYELDEGERHHLQQLWAALTHGTGRKEKPVSLALRRFRDAMSREQSEDRLLDLMIAAEAIF